MKPWLHAVMWTSLAVVGCTQAVFPPDVADGIDPAFDFARWHAAPTLTPPAKIQLGGRILETQTIGDTVTIVVAELTVVRFPAYGPKQGKSKGTFVITYRGKIERPFLHPGNRIMVVGMTSGSRLVAVDDVMRSLPSVDARCLHIWKTGDVDISDFMSSGAGYGVLEEETLCVSS
ncbi:MAG TPA: Slp family lipoprotein [Nitrospira sp.]|nr:Slp family lipoprotein [Nitrospira sp.]